MVDLALVGQPHHGREQRASDRVVLRTAAEHEMADLQYRRRIDRRDLVLEHDDEPEQLVAVVERGERGAPFAGQDRGEPLGELLGRRSSALHAPGNIDPATLAESASATKAGMSPASAGRTRTLLRDMHELLTEPTFRVGKSRIELHGVYATLYRFRCLRNSAHPSGCKRSRGTGYPPTWQEADLLA